VKLKLQTLSIEEDGCFSELLDETGKRLCFTLERTFDNNAVIIPNGTFNCVKTFFHRGGYNTFELTGVEGHERLLFHCGNSEADSIGCILVGLSQGVLDGKKAILQSRAAFAVFNSVTLGLDEFDLEVTGRDEFAGTGHA
jgi:hypothetical protein